MKKKIVGTLILICLNLLPPLMNDSARAQTNSQLFFLDGSTKTAAEIVAEEKVVLFFWTTWCPYCRTEMKIIDEKYGQYAPAKIFYVNSGERASTVEAFIAANKFLENSKSKIILDRYNLLASKYSIIGLPTYIFLQKGEVVFETHGLDADTMEKAFTNE